MELALDTIDHARDYRADVITSYFRKLWQSLARALGGRSSAPARSPRRTLSQPAR
jgi:hypothetical protein